MRCDKYIILETAHIKWFHGVVVITPDFESGNLGSNPSGTYIFFDKKRIGICTQKSDGPTF